MRVATPAACLLLCISGISSILSAQQPPCPVQSTYERAHTENLADLRRSLYVLSRLSESKDIDIKTRQGLADASVFSLANIYSLRARVRQSCEGITAEQYNHGLAFNERFIALFSAATSARSLWVENEQEIASFVDRASVVARRKLVFEPEIHKRLNYWRAQGQRFKDGDSLSLASSQLLSGKEGDKRDEGQLTPLQRTIPINPGVKTLSSATLSECLAFIESDPIRTLKTLSGYYLGRGRP